MLEHMMKIVVRGIGMRFSQIKFFGLCGILF